MIGRSGSVSFGGRWLLGRGYAMQTPGQATDRVSHSGDLSRVSQNSTAARSRGKEGGRGLRRAGGSCWEDLASSYRAS